MKLAPETLRLYAVTDRRWLRPGETLAEAVEELLRAGVTMVQLREKGADDGELLREAGCLQEVCRLRRVPLIINDRPDIAKAVGAAGVHVGRSDMAVQKARELLGEGYIIGASAHNVAEALEAQAAGADYLGCGAVFGSSTKKNVTGLSLEELSAICRAVDIPVVAIGGISLENAGRLCGTGIAGAAIVSGLFAAEDKTRAAKEFLRILSGRQIGGTTFCRGRKAGCLQEGL